MNRPYILTRRNLNPTAKLLAQELGIRRYFEPRDYAPAIRWGNSDTILPHDTKYNSCSHIRSCSDKLQFDEDMRNKDIPNISIHSYNERFMPEKYPVVVRQNLHGTRGQGIVICESLEELNNTPNHRYWTYWYDFKFELGVHMLGGKVVRVFKKVRVAGEEEEKYPIRNLHRGYHYSLVNLDKYEKLIPFMNNVYEHFPLEMGRWDIGWDRDNKTYRVIEANSAPGLAENENTRQLYVDFLKEKLNV